MGEGGDTGEKNVRVCRYPHPCTRLLGGLVPSRDARGYQAISSTRDFVFDAVRFINKDLVKKSKIYRLVRSDGGEYLM